MFPATDRIHIALSSHQPPSHFLLPFQKVRNPAFDFLEFFFAPRNRGAVARSVCPTIRAGLACGIVKLKLDLAGSRKRPRLVFWAVTTLVPSSLTLPCVF